MEAPTSNSTLESGDSGHDEWGQVAVESSAEHKVRHEAAQAAAAAAKVAAEEALNEWPPKHPFPTANSIFAGAETPTPKSPRGLTSPSSLGIRVFGSSDDYLAHLERKLAAVSDRNKRNPHLLTGNSAVAAFVKTDGAAGAAAGDDGEGSDSEQRNDLAAYTLGSAAEAPRIDDGKEGAVAGAGVAALPAIGGGTRVVSAEQAKKSLKAQVLARDVLRSHKDVPADQLTLDMVINAVPAALAAAAASAAAATDSAGAGAGAGADNRMVPACGPSSSAMAAAAAVVPPAATSAAAPAPAVADPAP